MWTDIKTWWKCLRKGHEWRVVYEGAFVAHTGSSNFIVMKGNAVECKRCGEATVRYYGRPYPLADLQNPLFTAEPGRYNGINHGSA